MSISSEYAKYRSGGGELTEREYEVHLDRIKTFVGRLIDHDPKDIRSDIGRKIFGYLDLQSAIAFSQVSKGLHERSKNRWFTTQAREIVLKYVQKEMGYKEYLKKGGWRDFFILAAKALGIALTVVGKVEADIHHSRIPIDAPKDTTSMDGIDGTTYHHTTIHHPEAEKAQAWTHLEVTFGSITTFAILGHGLAFLLDGIDPKDFFNASEKELFDSIKANAGLKVISPDFYKWQIKEMKRKLTSNPSDWKKHPVLSTMVCPLSSDFMLFPVKDSCGHYFDYRSIRAYQLQSASPLECPVSTKRPNRGLASVQFDKAKFDSIQGILRQ